MKQKKELSKGAASGIVALIFLVLGFQVAMFVTRFSLKVEGAPQEAVEQKDQKDQGEESIQSGAKADAVHGYAPKSSGGSAGRSAKAGGDPNSAGRGARSGSGLGRRPTAGRTKLGGYPAPEPSYSKKGISGAKKPLAEPFEFDPNSVSVDELQDLGLSERQAEVIQNYREKGGKFRKKEDFAKMYVVSEALFARLEPYINIPKVELNGADSAALVSLYGIGPYFAKKILAYRERLGGFYSVEQLMEVDGMNQERFDGLKEYIVVDSLKIKCFPIWILPQDSIAKHPYIGAYAAKGIVRFRSVCDSTQWTVSNLIENGILSPANGAKLMHYSGPNLIPAIYRKHFFL